MSIGDLPSTFNPGEDALRAHHMTAISEELRALSLLTVDGPGISGSVSPGGTGITFQPPSLITAFLGIVRKEGPTVDGAPLPDYKDERYWVEEHAVTAPEMEDDPETPQDESRTPSGDRRIVLEPFDEDQKSFQPRFYDTAVNTSEIEAHTHTVPVGAIVRVHTTYAADTGERHRYFTHTAGVVAYLWAGHGDPEGELYGNAFEAVPWDGVATAPDDEAPRLWIALPWALRRDTWDGKTLEVSPDPANPVVVTYTMVSPTHREAQIVGGDLFNEFVGPKWSFAEGSDTLHSVLYASAPSNGTGLSLDGVPVVLLDLNVDGRRWITSAEGEGAAASAPSNGTGLALSGVSARHPAPDSVPVDFLDLISTVQGAGAT